MTGFLASLCRRPSRLGVAAAAVLVINPPAPAQNAEVLANLKGYGLQQYLQGNSGGYVSPRPSYDTPGVYLFPQRSTLQVEALPYQHAVPMYAPTLPQFALSPAPASGQPGAAVPRVETKPVAYMIAHLPPGADLWLDDKLIFSDVKAPELTMVTPPLEKGTWYSYTVRVRWSEDGKWVGQMHTFDIRAGDIHHIEVTPSTAPSVQKEIAANMAALPAADKKAAEAQKFCAVQDTIRLGSMGPPVKVTLDGKDVYLCCKGCEKAAKKDPAKAVATAAKNKDKDKE